MSHKDWRRGFCGEDDENRWKEGGIWDLQTAQIVKSNTQCILAGQEVSV